METARPVSPVRILIVDDSALYRLMIRDVLRENAGCEVVGVAEDGDKAVAAIEKLRPDLITLDVEMPGLSGIEVLKRIQRRSDCRAVMISRFTDAGAEATAEALMLGALDFIQKPSSRDPDANRQLLRDQLATKISAFRHWRDGEAAAPRQMATTQPCDQNVDSLQPTLAQPGAKKHNWKCSIVVIGCSTGGPEALGKILPQLPGDLSVPLVIVQHMPERFTAALAKRLDQSSQLSVCEAVEGLSLRPGHAVVACGGRHLGFTNRDGQVGLHLSDAPPEHSCRPAVDFTLRAACRVFGGGVLSVVLTGMGRDGTAGSVVVRQLGGRVLAQDAAGCALYGMPKAVIESQVAHRVVKIGDIPDAICDELP